MKKEYIRRLLSAFCLISFWMQGCKQAELDEEKSEVGHHSTYFDLKVNSTILQVEIAASPEERARGLMFRDSLETSQGMLFIFKTGTKQRFWMKNTRIPLDIGYFSSNGVLLEIHKGKPHDLAGVPSKSEDVKFVLELNEGAFKKLGINLGDRIKIKEVAELLNLKGLEPWEYGIKI